MIRVYPVCHSQQSDHGREVGGSKPTSAVLCPWARHFTPRKYWLITQEAVAPSRHDWKIVDWYVKPQHKHKHKFSALWSGSTLLAILSSLIKVKVYTVILRNNLIRVYPICHSQQSGQGLHYLPFSAVWSRSRSTLSFSGTVWSGSTLFVILCSLISVYCFPFTIIWSGSILFAIQSLIKFYTVCHSQQSDECLHYLPFSAVRSGTTLFAILSSLIRFTLFAILSLIRIYTICHSL